MQSFRYIALFDRFLIQSLFTVNLLLLSYRSTIMVKTKCLYDPVEKSEGDWILVTRY